MIADQPLNNQPLIRTVNEQFLLSDNGVNNGCEDHDKGSECCTIIDIPLIKDHPKVCLSVRVHICGFTQNSLLSSNLNRKEMPLRPHLTLMFLEFEVEFADIAKT